MKKGLMIVVALIMLMRIGACSRGEVAENSVSKPEAEPSESAEVTYDESTPIVENDNVVYISNHADFFETYDTMEELDDHSDAIVTGKCVKSEAVFQNECIYTLSTFEVEEVYRGTIEKGSTIFIVEEGGRAYEDVYAHECGFDKKEFFDAETLREDVLVVSGTNGYFPMDEGQELMLFLQDSTGFLEDFSGTLYTPTGGADGKLLQMSETDYRKPLPSNVDQISAQALREGESLTITTRQLEALAAAETE